jgi:hypothetical protein
MPRCALPTPSESIRCRCRAAQLRAGQCLATAQQFQALPSLVVASLRTAVALPVSTLNCHRTAGRFAAMRHCDAVFAPPRHSESMRLLAHALRFIAQPCPGWAMQCPSIAGPWPTRRCAYRCPCGSGPYNASAIPSESVPAHCRAKLRHRTALHCHRVAPNAAQFLAIALQV